MKAKLHKKLVIGLENKQGLTCHSNILVFKPPAAFLLLLLPQLGCADLILVISQSVSGQKGMFCSLFHTNKHVCCLISTKKKSEWVAAFR